MDSIIPNKTLCAACNKSSGFTCRGCSRDFCQTHTKEHRQLLSKQMDEEIKCLHDQIKHNITKHVKKPTSHPLMKEIDEWENNSIKTIRQNAAERRETLLHLLKSHTDYLKTTLSTIKNQMTKARRADDFFEYDLEEWKKNLEKLKNDLNTQQTRAIVDANAVKSFIPKISIIEVVMPCESFVKSIGNAQIQDNGKLVVQGNVEGHSAVRGKGEYSSGCHRFRFSLENLHNGKWVFFGIVSKAVPLQQLSHRTLGTYGWAGGNLVFLNGIWYVFHKGYKTEMETNHTIELTLDCDQKKIRLRNVQTQSTYELDIDENNCPFPWQISLNLYYPGDCIRLL